MDKSLLNCKTDEADIVVEPELHDSVLTKLKLNQDSVVLTFMMTNNEKVSIYLIGIADFICNGLRKGNIVLDLTVSSGSEAPFHLLEKLINKPKQNNPKFEEFLTSLKNKILNSDLYLVQLNPSYGCEMIALCEMVKYSTNE